MVTDEPQSIRARLVELDDELRGLPSDAFARKHELLTEGDRHRKRLAELLQPELDAASDEWAERAGRKGTHSVDEGEQLGAAAIVSPGQSCSA